MPRTARSPEEIEAVKEQILRTAMEVICAEGFAQLSMRELAARLGMTATNIYNYYANKDDIYLCIQTRGFQMLYERLRAVIDLSELPLERLRGMIQAYLEFGFKNKDYYEVMLNRDTPKFADYVGTPLESVAFTEKSTALQVVDLTARVIAVLANLSPQEAQYRTIQMWATLHGVVSLTNSRVLQEMDMDMDTIIQRITADLLLPFHQS